MKRFAIVVMLAAAPLSSLQAQKGQLPQSIPSNGVGEDDDNYEDDGTGPCVWCHGDCEVGKHIAGDWPFDLPLVWHRNGGAHRDGLCRTGSCATKHGPEGCEGGELAYSKIDGIRHGIRENNLAVLTKVVASYPTSIVVNKDRSAVQLLNCKGGVIAHLPIRPQDVQLLASTRRMALGLAVQKGRTILKESLGTVQGIPVLWGELPITSLH